MKNNRKKLLIIQAMHPSGLKQLEQRPDVAVEVLEYPTQPQIRAALADTEAVAIRTATLGADDIAAAPHLKVVSRHGVGYDSIDVPALTARRIPLTIVGDVNTITVAEHALYMMLELAKAGRAHDRAMRANDFKFRDRFAAIELWQKTVLIVGFGRIGRALTKRCLAFDMTVLAHDPLVDAAAIAAAGAKPVADFRAVLPQVDYLSVHVPLLPATRGMIGATELARMKPSAIVINVARGGIVDEAALHAALSAGKIRGAGLDVFVAEPPPPDHPLLKLDNVVLSPHNAGLTLECAERMSIVTIRNALAGLDGALDPTLVVNREVLNP